jgi:hypothetical protein
LTFAAFDISSPDGGETWNGYKCGYLTTFEGTFGDLTEYNRIQASVTEDGTKVFISWLDTHFEGVTTNVQPDIFILGINMEVYLKTEVVNVTELTAGWMMAYLFSAPHYVFEDGDTYTIPLVYLDMDPVVPTDPVTFMYIKDFSFSVYDFYCPIDVTTSNAGPDGNVCEGDSYTLSGSATGYSIFVWTTAGDGTFDNPNILEPVYTPGTNDIESGSVTLTLTGYNLCRISDSDDMILTILPLPGVPSTPTGPDYADFYYNQTSDYTTTGSANAISYTWDIQPGEAGSISGTTLTAMVSWNDTYEGIALVKVKGINSCGESVFSQAIEVTVHNTTGFGEMQNTNLTIQASPNPSTGEFMLTIGSRENITIQIRIMDALGNIVYKENNVQVVQSLTRKISLNNLNKGIYFLLLDSGKSTQSEKIVIQK